MKYLPIATLFAVLPCAALAQSQLERMEAVSEASNAHMMQLMVQEMAANGADGEALQAALPDMEWDADFRAAGTCMLEVYEAEIGSDGIDEMLTKMEGFTAEMEGKSLEELADASDVLPEGITPERSMEISQDCGMVDLQMARMSESGFMEAMMGASQGN